MFVWVIKNQEHLLYVLEWFIVFYISELCVVYNDRNLYFTLFDRYLTFLHSRVDRTPGCSFAVF